MLITLILSVKHEHFLSLQQLQRLQHLGNSGLLILHIVFGIVHQKGLHISGPKILGKVGLHKILGLLSNFGDSHLGGCGPARGENVHINQASGGVGCCLLRGHLYQVDGLLHIREDHLAGEPHFGEGLAQSDQRFKLPRRRSDDLLVVAQLPHIDVSALYPPPRLLSESRVHVLPRVADILGQHFLAIDPNTKSAETYLILCDSLLEYKSRICEARRLSFA